MDIIPVMPSSGVFDQSYTNDNCNIPSLPITTGAQLETGGKGGSIILAPLLSSNLGNAVIDIVT